MKKQLKERVLSFCELELPVILALIAIMACLVAISSPALANIPRLPGEDPLDKLSAAGSLFRLADSLIFKIAARFMSGLLVLGSAWHLKESRYAIAGLCLLAAALVGFSPLFVKNIFDAGGGTIFSYIRFIGSPHA